MFLRRLLCLWITISFIFTLIVPPQRLYAQTVLDLPIPGTMVSVSPSFEPALLKGLTVHKDNPFLFDFIVDPGQSKVSKEVLKDESLRMIKYFFAALTIPDKDIWVNLSPYEKDRMIPVSLGQTAMGRDLLAQDYMLKQLTASLICPQKALGKTFWDKVYSKAKAMYGTTEIPVNTFNKVWIVPQKAGVYEHGQTAFIVSGHLKVMLEEDYLSMSKHADVGVSRGQDPNINVLGSKIIRAIILPEIEKEINEGKNFATLRQIFYAQVLAVWFKRNLKQALLNRVYADKGTVKGIDQNDTATNEAIYHQYLKAYKKGVFNYIKEDIDPVTQEPLPRKYFSGGYGHADQLTIEPARISSAAMVGIAQKDVDFAVLASGKKRVSQKLTAKKQASWISKPSFLTMSIGKTSVPQKLPAQRQASREQTSSLSKSPLLIISIAALTLTLGAHSIYQSIASKQVDGNGTLKVIKGLVDKEQFPAAVFNLEYLLNNSNKVDPGVLKQAEQVYWNGILKFVTEQADKEQFPLARSYLDNMIDNSDEVDPDVLNQAKQVYWQSQLKFITKLVDKEQFPAARSHLDGMISKSDEADPGVLRQAKRVYWEGVLKLITKLVDKEQFPAAQEYFKYMIKSANEAGPSVLKRTKKVYLDGLAKAAKKHKKGPTTDTQFSSKVRLTAGIKDDLHVKGPGRTDAAMMGSFWYRSMSVSIILSLMSYFYFSKYPHGYNPTTDMIMVAAPIIAFVVAFVPLIVGIVNKIKRAGNDARATAALKKSLVIEPQRNGSKISVNVNPQSLTYEQKLFFQYWLIEQLDSPVTRDVNDTRYLSFETVLSKEEVGNRIKANRAQISEGDKAALTDITNGGIDLSQQDAALHVEKDVNGGVKVNVDQALIARIEREGMPELVPVIINMQPADIRFLFGEAEVL